MLFPPPSRLSPDRSSLGEANVVLLHERLEGVDVNAVPDVKEGTVLDALLVAVAHHFYVDVEVEVEMVGGELHAADAAPGVERGACALGPGPGSRARTTPHA